MSKFKTPTGQSRTPRQLRVGEELRHALAAAFQDGNYPWETSLPRSIITVTEVRVSPDLRNATAYIVTLGGQHSAETVKVLNQAKYYFKNVIAQNVELRFVPQLHFQIDTSFEYAERIERILHDPNVARDLKHDDTEE
ncbi:MAG: 30S ribosome-binding factor RbfA [Alphaproteobacteria bacterium]|nr:30S ribosome-binding factor RbfA [Alphaproteobacteria bacterium]